MMYAHMNDPPPSLSGQRPDLPPQVDAVIARALAKSADDRFATAGEFFADLRDAIHAEAAPVAAAVQPSVARPAVPAAAEETAAPEAAPEAPPLVDVFAIDVQGARFGLGRTATGYAIWDTGAGGAPVRAYPLSDESWTVAWAEFQRLESSPDPTGEAAVGAPAVEQPRDSAPGEPLIMGVVFLDYRGQRYALGRTDDSYAIWDLQAGGYPVQAFALHDQGWQAAWARYQELEASPGAATDGVPAAIEAEAAPEAVAEPEPRPLEGAVALDYQGSGYALGRTSDAYAIWDVAAGGSPVQVFGQDGDGWNSAWEAFQQLEARLAQR